MIDGAGFCSVTIDDVVKIQLGDMPKPYKYAYAYTISIENTSSIYSIQILSRKWVIKDGDMKDRVVTGEKVVGKTPILKEGDIFTYQSYHVMQTSFGEASGFYYGVYAVSNKSQENQDEKNINGDPFYIKIPLFKLITPHK